MTKMSRRCSGNGDNISSNPKIHLDHDFVEHEILTRLPVKSLYRFKCVRKRWQSLIEDDSEFAGLHFARSKTRPGGNAMLISTNSEEDGISMLLSNQIKGCTPEIVSWLTIEGNATIVKPVNGLICFVNKEEGRVRFVNLFTREETPWIETTQLTQRIEEELTQRIEEEEGDEIYVRKPLYGFGFDPITKEHKLVRSATAVVGNPFKNTVKLSQICDVMTVGDNTWRRLDDAHPPDRVLVGDAVHVNGTIYWTSAGPYSEMNPEIDSLVAFDVGNEKFRVIPIPQFILVQLLLSNRRLEGDLPIELLEVDGRLALLGRQNSGMAHMWIFKDLEDKEKINTTDNVIIEKFPLLPAFPWDERKSYSFQAIAGKKLILEYYKNEKLAFVFLYDLKERSVSRMSSSEGDKNCERANFATFFESIFPVQKKHKQTYPPPASPGN